ncbi:MAG: glutamate synthase subunit beta [Fibrobacter sp.]|nr:glutamate synthase subunit beta [Fibrobacter sp.]
MGKATGFMEYARVEMQKRPVSERISDYHEVTVRHGYEKITRQGARCMDCGIPYCHAMGCPVLNLIPEFNDLVYRGKWKEAYERLEITNNLPEITGRICPALCEASCTLSINTSPVAIKQIELVIIERAFAEGWVVPVKPEKESGKKVAVIGSGPSGLAAAQQLRRYGHKVTVFEKSDKIGGLLRYGVPGFKLEKHVIDRRVNSMKEEGVVFETDITAGEDISVRYLRKSFDVVLLTAGAGHPRNIVVPGRGLEGIHYALEYLKGANLFSEGEASEHQILSARNKAVLVLGGGDTGADCVGTAVRQGAKKIYQYEIMPKPLEWGYPHNPSWPYWPQILRTSTSHEEGCERDWNLSIKAFSGRDIKVQQAHFVRVEWKRNSETGVMGMQEIPDSDVWIDIDMVLLAMGFVHTEHNRLTEDLGVEFDKKGNIKTDGSYATSVKGVFAAGDAATGASLVVRAIFHGREAAASINKYLS